MPEINELTSNTFGGKNNFTSHSKGILPAPLGTVHRTVPLSWIHSQASNPLRGCSNPSLIKSAVIRKIEVDITSTSNTVGGKRAYRQQVEITRGENTLNPYPTEHTFTAENGKSYTVPQPIKYEQCERYKPKRGREHTYNSNVFMLITPLHFWCGWEWVMWG